MERVVDRMHRAGVKVILGTPTYSIPPWLYRKQRSVQERTNLLTIYRNRVR
jgi:beta-galactosidase